MLLFYYSGTINEYIEKDNAKELVDRAENMHTLQFEMLRKLICETSDNNTNNYLSDAVFVTGPSSSGKTTFSNHLAEALTKEGFNCTVISFDDYYLDHEYIVYSQRIKNKDKSDSFIPDYECLESFDVKFFKTQMNQFMQGETIILPKYDFTVGKRTNFGKTLTRTKKNLFILEGIHALNPLVTQGLSFDKTFGVYICPFDCYKSDYNNTIIQPNQIRFMRRAIRDMYCRNSSLKKTIGMWKSVRDGEEKYIKPMKKYADFFFNSSLEYEICILKYYITIMAQTLDKETHDKFKEILPLDALNDFMASEKIYFPDSSLLKEFISITP